MAWMASKKGRKQVKFRHNAPLHIRGRFLNSRLSKDLTKKYRKRSARICQGDKVRIMSGQFRGKTGKVAKVRMLDSRLEIEGIEAIKKDGSKVPRMVHASKVMITELNTDDKKRMNRPEARK